MDIYKVGVEIALRGNIEAALGALGKQFVGLQGDVDKIGSSILGWGSNMQAVAGIAAGAAVIGAFKTLFDYGEKLVHVQQQLAVTGVSPVEAAQAQAAAWKTSAKYGLEVAGVLSDIKEAQMVFGSTGHAIDFIDPLEKMRVVLNSTMGEGKSQDAADAVYQMARAGELKGLQTPEQFMSYFDSMTKAETGSGGIVGPREFMQATKYGKISSKGWDQEFFGKYLPSLIQEYGPTTAGQSLMSLYGSIEQGKNGIKQVQAMDDLGLFADKSKIRYNKMGDSVGFAPGAVVGSDLFTKNPYKWAQEVLKPLVEKKLGHEVTAGDKSALDLLAGMFGNRNAAAAISSLLLENKRLDKDAGLIGRSQGLDAADQLLAHDPTAVMNNFSASWHNLLTALGEPLVEPVINAMNGIAAAFNAITAAFHAHPDAMKFLGSMVTATSIAPFAPGQAAKTAGDAALDLLNSGLKGGATPVPSVAPGTGIYPGSGPAAPAAPKSFGLYPGSAPPSNIQITPQIQGTATVNIDGKQVATALMPMIMKMIGGLIPHPTGAPMASSSNGAPAFDSSHGGF